MPPVILLRRPPSQPVDVTRHRVAKRATGLLQTFVTACRGRDKIEGFYRRILVAIHDTASHLKVGTDNDVTKTRNQEQSFG